MGKTLEDLKKSRERRQEILDKYGEVPKSIWEIDYSVGKNIIEYEGRKQHNVALEKHKKMGYDKSLHNEFSVSSQNVRGKDGGLSTFPPDLVKRVLQYYTEPFETVLDPCCVSGDTKISIPGGEVEIKDLVGKEMYVYCHDGKSLHLRKAYNIRKTKTNTEVIKLYFDNGQTLLITPEHKIMKTSGEWIEANNSLECSIIPFYRKIHKIVKIEKYPLYIDVYNMEVEEFNNFFANGICVHNCGHNSRMQATYLLQRNYIGYDVSKEFMEFNREVYTKITEETFSFQEHPFIVLREQSSENLLEEDNSMDLIFTSPPYYNVEWYGDEPEQLGKESTYEGFLNRMEKILAESYRVLKPEKFCVFNINDFRSNNIFYPYHADIIKLYQKVGYRLWDVIIIKWKSAIGACFASQVEDRKVTAKSHEYLIVGKK